jgi:hypothetical protein
MDAFPLPGVRGVGKFGRQANIGNLYLQRKVLFTWLWLRFCCPGLGSSVAQRMLMHSSPVCSAYNAHYLLHRKLLLQRNLTKAQRMLMLSS